MDAINSLIDLFAKCNSFDNAIRKQSEAHLASLETQNGFLIAILQIVGRKEVAEQIRLMASVYFKNAIKRRWLPGEDSECVPIAPADREAIKAHLVDLMCSTSASVQKQLAEAVSLIAKYDFPEKWEYLLPQLVQKLGMGDLRTTQGVMITANSIMKRYRYAYKSDALFQEILVCLNAFQIPLLETYKKNSEAILSASNDKEALITALEIQRLVTRIFFSLNWQDIPEFFEDHIAEWMGEFNKFLAYKNPAVVAAGTSEAGPIERLQAAIVENLNLYATKYEEEFKPFLGTFTQAVWTLLLQVGREEKYDILATNSIKFLTSVCSKQMNVELFNEQVLKDIVEHIIIPNLMATEIDEENFEGNPTDYIRKDMEGSDTDTRRRCAIEFIRALLKFFGPVVSKLCLDYIGAMLEQYRTRQDWRSKDAALHLVLAVSVLSAGTQGAGELNPNVNILDIFGAHVLPEVEDSNINARPIVKADAIKLICLFRTHLQAPFLLSILPHFIRHLSSESVVVQTYAALSIEKFLSLKDRNETGANVSRITKENIMNQMEALFSGLFAVLDNPELPENDYVMKCIMRTLSILGANVVGLVSLILPRLTKSLERICKNPVNPHFNHFLFESIAILVKSSCTEGSGVDTVAACSHFESALFPSFQMILTQDVVEFVPYVFQVFAQLLCARPKNSGLSPAYRGLLQPLLAPVLWERKGNVPALTDLFRSYICTGMSEIVAGQHLEAVLGIFQKLLSSKSSECYAFKLLNDLITYNSLSTLSPYLSTIWNLLFIRMQEQMKDNKTPRYCRLFLHCLAHFAIVHGAKPLHGSIEQVGNGLMTTIVVQIWKPNKEACSALEVNDIKELLAGGTKLLCETVIKDDLQTWATLLDCLLCLVVPAETARKSEEDELFHVLEEAADREFDSTYSKLAFASIPETALSAEANQAVSYFIISLSALYKTNAANYKAAIRQGITTENGSILMESLRRYNQTEIGADLSK